MKSPLFSVKNLIFSPFIFLLQMSPVWALALMFVFVSVCGFLYYSLNSDFFGLAAPPFADLTFSEDFTSVRDNKDGQSWKISYEAIPFSVFHGVVRHVSNWRDEPLPFATHDILITTGDFSSTSQVTTRVNNHTFYYQWTDASKPQGTINLLHIVPRSEDIYRQLLMVRDWNLVTISGREIYRIEVFDASGKFTSYWQDRGCNTILVTAVKIAQVGTPIP